MPVSKPAHGAPNWDDTLNAVIDIANSVAGTPAQITALTAVVDGKASKAANLSDVDASTARTNLGLGSAAVRPVGVGAGTVAAGDDPRVVAANDLCRQPAAAALLAALATAHLGTRRIAFTGSSTTAGQNATTPERRYVNRLVGEMQAAYPSGLGAESAVTTSTTASFGTLATAVGVHGYNAGISSTSSVDFLTSTTRPLVAALAPSAVFIMVGANDYMNNTDPAVYKTNIVAQVAGLKSVITNPCTYILVHSYPRTLTSPATYAWALYGQQLADIAAADPTNCAFLDLSGPVAALGWPGADPLDLIDPDNTHQTDNGHAFMTELLARSLGLPNRPAGGVTRVMSRITSDLLTTTSADLSGRATDAALGGSTRTWTADTGVLQVTGGAIVRGATNPAVWFGGLPTPGNDIELSVVLTAIPSASTYFDVRRAAATGSPDTYRMVVSGTAGVTLAKRVSGVTTFLTPSVTVTAGDRLTFRCHRGLLEWRQNGTVQARVLDTSIPSGGWCGLTGTASNTLSVAAVTVDVIT